MERMPVPAAREGSWEDVLHRAGASDKLLILSDGSVPEHMLESRGHRAIGVVYDPAYEAFGNYVPTVLPCRYDAFLYLDETLALHPLHIVPRVEPEPPETFPTAV
jgi:erythromycin esterase-like protein